MAELKWLVNRGNYYYFGDAPVHATGVSLDKNSITLTTAGQTEQLNATVSPDDAVEKKVHWSSSDLTVATVTQTGLVTCVTPGSCVITATCDGVSASCSVAEAKYVDFLLVGGGGSGGYAYFTTVGGGGGGGGGFVECYNYSIMTGDYSVVIGAGGVASNQTGCTGGNTTFDGVIAYGGGGGGAYNGAGGNGGSGGGGGGMGGGAGGTACNSQGYNGGAGHSGDFWGGAGGGGAGGVGGDARYEYGGVGGVGKSSSMSGTATYYAGGGGGGSCCYNTPGTGGTGGGGTGAAATYYGGGGAGGQQCLTPYNGWGYAGCQGIFILRYPTDCGYNITGGTKYICGSYTIHCFTENGTLTVG